LHRLEENLGAANIELSEKDLRDITQRFRKSRYKAIDTRRICSKESIVELGGAALGPRFFIE